jgi:hypothetical protein
MKARSTVTARWSRPTSIRLFPLRFRAAPAGRGRPLAAAFFPMPTFGRSPYPLPRRLNLCGPTMVSAPTLKNPFRLACTQHKQSKPAYSTSRRCQPRTGLFAALATEVRNPALSKHQSRLNILTTNSQAMSQNTNIRPRSENTNLQEFLSPSSTDRHLEAARRSATQCPGALQRRPKRCRPAQATPYSTSSLKRATVVDGSARRTADKGFGRSDRSCGGTPAREFFHPSLARNGTAGFAAWTGEKVPRLRRSRQCSGVTELIVYGAEYPLRVLERRFDSRSISVQHLWIA